MTPQELKAVLNKTNEVAVFPIHIETPAPYWASPKKGRTPVCPSGLTKATVIQTGVKWTEKRPVSQCGDTDYDIQHRNGVLIEFPFSGQVIGNRQFAQVGGCLHIKTNGKRHPHPYKHTSIFRRDGQKFVRMIVSHKVIGAPWGEYTMIEAQREKEEERCKQDYLERRTPQAALMGMTLEEFEKKHISNSPEHDIYLNTDTITLYERDRKGDYKRDKLGARIVKEEVRKIEITLDQANKILNLLTDKQKAALRENLN